MKIHNLGIITLTVTELKAKIYKTNVIKMIITHSNISAYQAKTFSYNKTIFLNWKIQILLIK